MPDENNNDKAQALKVITQAAADAIKVVANAASEAKKVIALESELALEKRLKTEREESNSSYAPIIIKTIVFGAIALICVAFMGWLTALVWPK